MVFRGMKSIINEDNVKVTTKNTVVIDFDVIRAFTPFSCAMIAAYIKYQMLPEVPQFENITSFVRSYCKAFNYSVANGWKYWKRVKPLIKALKSKNLDVRYVAIKIEDVLKSAKVTRRPERESEFI